VAHPLDKTVTIRSNDPDQPVFILHLKANLRTTLSTDSKFLAFNLVQAGNRTSAVIHIKNDSKDNVTITDFKADPSDMKVSISKGTQIPAGKQIDIELSFVPSKAKMYQPQFTLLTSDVNFPEMKFFGRCEVVDYDPYSPVQTK
jgi:hypothetical protein